MIARNPVFIGDRLRQARLALKLTQTQLAELVDKKPNTISAYEADKISPTDEVIRALSNILGQPVDFFYKIQPILKNNAIFYRSMSASTKTARDKAESRLSWLREIYSFSEEYIDFPDTNFPDYPNLPEDPRNITKAMIEDVANWVRQSWGLTDRPIPNLIRLVESKGGVIAFDLLDESSLDALSEWGHPERIPYFLLNSDVDSSVRLRFNLAHELGHMFLHRYLNKEDVERSKELFKIIEDQAFYFAGAFLVPKEAAEYDLAIINVERLKLLKRKWKISMAALLKRAEGLGLLEKDYSTRLWKSMAQKGWRKREPYDDEFLIEEPYILKTAFETLVKEGVFSAEELENEISIGKRYIQALCYLDEQFFRPPVPALKIIKFNAR